MTRVLLVGDVHLSDRPPASCTDTYQDDLFGLLEQTVERARQHNVDACVWLGDVFHHKTPSRTSHRTVLRLIELLRSYPCPVWVVPGNHDMSNDRLESVWESQPLGVVFRTGAAEPLVGWHPTLPVYGVPWKADWETWPAREDIESLVEHQFGSGMTTYLVAMHAPIYPPGFEPPHEFVSGGRVADYVGQSGWVAYGHVHEAHNVWFAESQPEVSGHPGWRTPMCNMGALTRGSLAEHDLTREPAVALWTPQAGFVPLTLEAKPPEAVFRLTEAQQVRSAQAKLDEFLTAVGSTTVARTSVEAVMEAVRAKGLEPEVLATVEDLLREAEGAPA